MARDETALWAVIEQGLGDEQRAELRHAVEQISEAISDLIPLMHGDDDGGAVRVGYMLVQLGKRIAGVE